MLMMILNSIMFGVVSRVSKEVLPLQIHPHR